MPPPKVAQTCRVTPHFSLFPKEMLKNESSLSWEHPQPPREQLAAASRHKTLT